MFKPVADVPLVPVFKGILKAAVPLAACCFCARLLFFVIFGASSFALTKSGEGVNGGGAISAI